MQRCKQMEQGVYFVQSESSANKSYKVTAFDGKPPTCTCPAFAIGRNRAKSNKPTAKKGQAWCKHIEYIYDTICQWDTDSDTVQREPGVCPACSGATYFDEDDGFMEVAEETAVTSLQDMIVELESKLND